MSHMTTVRTEFRDIDALKETFKGLDLTLSEDTRGVRMYGGSTARVEYGCRLPEGQYDVGFNLGAAGAYEMVCDSEVMYDRDNGRNNAARKFLGNGLAKLNQGYAAEVSIAAARRAGFFSDRREVQADGSMLVTITR